MSSNIAHVTEEISAVGFSVHEDARIGALVDSIIEKKFNFYSQEGFRLFRAVLQHDLVSNVIKAVLREPIFIFCRVFGHTRNKHCIVNRKDEAQMRIVTVWCCSSESNATIYSGSHSHYLGAKEADNSLLLVTDEALQHDSIQQRAQHMDRGGLAIEDARCAWQIANGKCILLGFAIPDEARHWKPMTFPYTLQNAVTNMMDGTGIAIRATFSRPTQPQTKITTTIEEEQAKTTSAANKDRSHDVTSDQGNFTPNLDNHEGHTGDTQHK